jgi:hypothetical protein
LIEVEKLKSAFVKKQFVDRLWCVHHMQEDIYIYIYIYIERERERESKKERKGAWVIYYVKFSIMDSWQIFDRLISNLNGLSCWLLYLIILPRHCWAEVVLALLLWEGIPAMAPFSSGWSPSISHVKPFDFQHCLEILHFFFFFLSEKWLSCS